MMKSKLKSAFSCFKGSKKMVINDDRREDDSDKDDANFESGASSSRSNAEPYIWSRGLDQHFVGEFSYAIVQANREIEDYSQVEVGKDGTFVGIYDGHGGAECANFLFEKLFNFLMNRVEESRTVCEEVMRRAVATVESEFKEFVRLTYNHDPTVAAKGSCCLIGVIWRGTLYVANLGDSRAVLGSEDAENNIVAHQLTEDHNAKRGPIRNELMLMHQDDPHIVIMNNKAWRIRGIIQVSRTIGDVYLKDPKYPIPKEYTRYQCAGGPIKRPVLRSDPAIYTLELASNDKFLIFASDGLWEYVSNEEAVRIVEKNSRVGIANRLIHKALRRAARFYSIQFATMRTLDKGPARRHFHDDITVVVIFIDNIGGIPDIRTGGASIRGLSNETTWSSRIDLLSNLPAVPAQDLPGPSGS